MSINIYDAAKWVRRWMKDHPNCKELNSMYEEFNNTALGYEWGSEATGTVTTLILDMEPLKYMDHIPDKMFFSCGTITDMIIPNGIISIGEEAFYHCTNLMSINIPNSVTSIGAAAFCECAELTAVNIPNGVTIINEAMFQNCSKLTAVTIPNSVTSIGPYVFSYSNNLTSINYEGTQSEWIAIKKHKNWKFGSSIKHINCSDGSIKLR